MEKYLKFLDNLIPMGIFWNKKEEKNVEPTFVERLEVLEALVSKLKREVLSNSMDLDTMRDKVLRKIQKRQKDNEQEENPLPDDGFGEIRKIGNNKVL